MKIVYLCGPINGASDGVAKAWRDVCKVKLSFKTIDPMDRDYRGIEAGNEVSIVEADKADIERCDALLYMYYYPTSGSSMEVMYAKTTGKPVVVIDASFGSMSPWIRYHCDAVVKNIDEANSVLKEILQ